MEKNNNLMIGLWKFSNNIGVKELNTIAQEWAKDDKYLQLYIRKTSKDQHGIGFTYKYDGTSKGYDGYFYEVSDKLKRQFGNDLVGWDISSSAVTVKGF